MHCIMTLSFFTNKVVHSYGDMLEEKMDLVVHELKRDERVRMKGLVIKKHLPLMLNNIKYPKRMSHDRG